MKELDKAAVELCLRFASVRTAIYSCIIAIFILPLAIIAVLSGLDSGDRLWTILGMFDLFMSGGIFGISSVQIRFPLKIRDFTKEQELFYEKRGHEIIAAVLADAKERGIIPDGIDISPSRMH